MISERGTIIAVLRLVLACFERLLRDVGIQRRRYDLGRGLWTSKLLIRNVWGSSLSRWRWRSIRLLLLLLLVGLLVLLVLQLELLLLYRLLSLFTLVKVLSLDLLLY